MSRRLLLPLLGAFAAILVIGPGGYAYGGTIALCDSANHIVTEGQCDLKGPVRTAETSLSLPTSSPPNPTSSDTFLAFDIAGRLTERRTSTDTGLRSDTVFKFSSDGRTLTIGGDGSSPGYPDEHLPVTIITFDTEGHEIKSESKDNGNSYMTEHVYDSTGRLLWESSGSSDRIEYKYDSQGRLIEEAAPSWRLDFEYPAANAIRELYFGGDFIPRDPNVADSVPTRVTETTNDPAGRPIKIVTTMPGANIDGWGCECTMPGSITIRYDDVGRVLDRTEYSPNGAIEAEDQYTYDTDGNMLSSQGLNPVKFSYEFDERGNWTRKETYRENADGSRTVWRIETRKVTYYQ